MDTLLTRCRGRFQSSYARLGYRLLLGLAYATRELRRVTKFDLFRLSTVRPEPIALSPLVTALRLATSKRIDCVRRPGPTPVADTPRVLICITSIGELNSLRALVNHLVYSGLTVGFVVHCPTTAHLIGEEIPEAEVVELPVDLRRNARSLLETLSPSLIIVGDSLYGSPLNFLTEAAVRRIPTVLLNGVPFDTPHAKPALWLRCYYREFFRRYSQIFVATAEAQERFLELGVDPSRIALAPNTRWIGSDLTSREKRVAEELAKLFQISPGRPVITVASLHSGEEALLIRLALEARTLATKPLIIVAPRSPHAWGGMNAELVKHGIVTAHRTGLACRQYANIKPEVIFLDMLGELRAALSLSTLCVMGGTFVGKGQNPLEALRLGVPVVLGPSTEWMSGICEEVVKRRAGNRVESMEDAADEALRLLNAEAERDRIVGCAYLLLREHHEDLSRLLTALPIPSIFASRHTDAHLPTAEERPLDPLDAMELQ